jgi:hypothetical protein
MADGDALYQSERRMKRDVPAEASRFFLSPNQATIAINNQLRQQTHIRDKKKTK